MASELAMSKSKLFVLAIEKFIKKNENKKLLSQINQAYADDIDKLYAIAMKKKQRQMMENEAW